MVNNDDLKIERIPDEDDLYMRVHKNLLLSNTLNKCHLENDIPPNVFIPRGSGLSTDWSKYSTPNETKQRARKPIDNGVIGMICGKVRQISLLEVKHAPSIKNYSHTNICNFPVDSKKITKTRVKLSRISKWLL